MDHHDHHGHHDHQQQRLSGMATINGPPPVHPRPEERNPDLRTNGGVQQGSVQQDPGSASHPQPPVFARPVFYVQAPPPPFLHYQWPVPFFNPFTGFPGMGYGMVVPPPPFPPPPYMEAPAYILPHPQPVDYRRFLHAQGPSHQNQNPNHPRRVRPPHPVSSRETVNSEVQTEPAQMGVGDAGWPLISSDSGQGTASNSPCSQKGAEPDGEVKCPVGTDAVESSRTGPAAELHTDPVVPPPDPCDRRDDHCSMWLAGSPDCTVPVCSSFQKEDGVFKERRISVPDILMSWGGCTKELPPDDHQNFCKPEVEAQNQTREQLVSNDRNKSLATDNDVNNVVSGSEDGGVLFKVLRFPCDFADYLESRKASETMETADSEFSLNSSQKIPEESGSVQDTADMVLYQMCRSSCRMKRKMNESVWSVESLAPFIPTRDWLLQNGLFETEVGETLEEPENVGPPSTGDDPVVGGVEKTVSASDSWLGFNDKNMKQSPPKMLDTGTDIPELRMPKVDPSVVSMETDAAPLGQTASTPTEDDGNGSSEPETNRSPTQESLEGSPRFPEEETLLLDSEETASSPGRVVASNGRDSEATLTLTAPKTPKASSSKGHLVDCGVQCNQLQERRCACEEGVGVGPNRRMPFKYSDLKAGNGKMETFCVNGKFQKKRSGQWRSRERQSGQQEAFNGFCKPGKSKSGNGRNPRY